MDYFLQATSYGSPAYGLILQLREAYVRSEDARLEALDEIEALLGTPPAAQNAQRDRKVA